MLGNFQVEIILKKNRGQRIKGADRKTFKIVDTCLAFHFGMDRLHYYEGGLIMTKEDIKRNGLDIK